jgi:hypothetical protein
MNYTNKKSFGNTTSTTCPKIGIKIHHSDNDYKDDPFTRKQSHLQRPVNYHNTHLNELDLDIDNYSLQDLFNLFNITNAVLDEHTLKQAKQIVLKMHPDKSRLEPKYFLFFSKAYKQIYGIYEFQNKSTKKTYKNEDFFDDENREVLDQVFSSNQNLKKPANFNLWFNEKFEKNRLENDDEKNGYGDWLKSDEGTYVFNGTVSKNNMNDIFETRKKEVQSITVYKGVRDITANTLGASSLSGHTDNYTGGQGSLGFTDLRQAYVESVIPVTQEDYERMPKFKNIGEYKTHRENASDVRPLSKEESEQLLHQNQRTMDLESTALAYKHAKQSEKIKQQQQSFWGELRQLTR